MVDDPGNRNGRALTSRPQHSIKRRRNQSYRQKPKPNNQPHSSSPPPPGGPTPSTSSAAGSAVESGSANTNGKALNGRNDVRLPTKPRDSGPNGRYTPQSGAKKRRAPQGPAGSGQPQSVQGTAQLPSQAQAFQNKGQGPSKKHRPQKRPEPKNGRPDIPRGPAPVDTPATMATAAAATAMHTSQLPLAPAAQLHMVQQHTPKSKEPSPAVSTSSDHRATGVVYSAESVFETLGQVGEGTYGKVYKACNRTTGLTVAMKRLRLESERDGFPITATREIKLLQSLRHPNVVKLYEMVVANRNVYMAFEYIDHDLSGLLQNTELILLPAHVKSITKQLLESLAYLHHKAVVHRDIKGPNILISSQGQLKLADFGLARTLAVDSPEVQYTNRVITRWYRPPELLLGATQYGPEIDMWGVGCLLVEMVLRRALFPGKDEISQLHEIWNVMGTPTSWPERVDLPWYYLVKEPPSKPNVFADVFCGFDISRDCFALAAKLLDMNPRTRISAAEALKSNYFRELPKEEPLKLAGIHEWHDFEAKKRRRDKREAERAAAAAASSAAAASVGPVVAPVTVALRPVKENPAESSDIAPKK